MALPSACVICGGATREPYGDTCGPSCDMVKGTPPAYGLGVLFGVVLLAALVFMMFVGVWA